MLSSLEKNYVKMLLRVKMGLRNPNRSTNGLRNEVLCNKALEKPIYVFKVLKHDEKVFELV